FRKRRSCACLWRRRLAASYVSPMRYTAIIAFFVIGCRTSDGHSQSAPPAARGDTTAAMSDSAREHAMFVRADLARVQGDSTGLWFLMVSDFQCPFCKRWHDEVYPILL